MPLSKYQTRPKGVMSHFSQKNKMQVVLFFFLLLFRKHQTENRTGLNDTEHDFTVLLIQAIMYPVKDITVK